jgi:hypothetical protein
MIMSYLTSSVIITNLRKWIFFILITTFCGMKTFAQVLINFRPPPPYQLKVEDFWKSGLINTSTTPYQVYLQGVAVHRKEGKIVECKTQVFNLPAGFKSLQTTEIGPVQIIEKNPLYEKAIRNAGQLPTGEYDICLRVINASTGDELAYECFQHTVQVISGIELLSPEDKSMIIAGDPGVEDSLMDAKGFKGEKLIINNSLLSFSWLPPTPAPRNGQVTYSLAIKEVFLNQTPYSSMLSNPAYYKVDNLLAPVYQYPFFARDFVHGKTYAWQVTLYLNGQKMNSSEVYSFVYRKPSLQLPIQELDTTHLLPTVDTSHSRLPIILNDISVGINRPEYGLKFTPEKNSDWDMYSPVEQDSVIQEKSGKKVFHFSGTARLSGIYSSRKGTNSDLPSRYMVAELSPTFSIYNIPLSTNILYSTMGDNKLQVINNFNLGLDQGKIQELLEEKKSAALEKGKEKIAQIVEERVQDMRTTMESDMREKIEKQVKEKGEEKRAEIEQREKLALDKKLEAEENKIRSNSDAIGDKAARKSTPGILRFMSAFKTFQIGTTYPDYSKHTLSGVPVKGFNIEFNPGILYLAGTAQKNTSAVEGETFKRNLAGGRFGLGKKDATHTILTLVHVQDFPNSINNDTLDLSLTPKENWVVGFNQQLSFFKKKLIFGAEGVVSMLTRDTRDPEIGIEEIPTALRKYLKPRGSTSADYMYGINATYENDSDTKLGAEMKMLGPGFTTLGNPAVRNDRLSYEGKFDQKVWKRRISFGVAYRHIEDNLLKIKTATTTSISQTYKLGINVKKYPTLKMMLMPSIQMNDKPITLEDSSRIENRMMLYNMVSSYSKKIGDLQSQTMISFSYNKIRSLFGFSDSWNRTSQLVQSITFKFPLTLTGGLGRVDNFNTTLSKVWTTEFSPSYTFKKLGQISCGFNLMLDKSISNRTGFNVNSVINLNKYFSLDFRAETNVFVDQFMPTASYQEYNLLGGITAKW